MKKHLLKVMLNQSNNVRFHRRTNVARVDLIYVWVSIETRFDRVISTGVKLAIAVNI